MPGDGLFYFPDVSFLYVHQGTISKMSDADWDSDDDGYPIHPPVTEVQVMGYAAPPNPTRDGQTITVDTVFVVPSDVEVAQDDMVILPEQPSLLRFLAGRYVVITVRPNPLHQRVMLKRAVSPAIDTENMGTIEQSDPV